MMKLNVFHQLKKVNYFWQWSLVLILVLCLFARMITGVSPILCKYKGEWHSFISSNKIKTPSKLSQDLNSIGSGSFRKLNYEFVIWPFISRDPYTLHLENNWKPPMTKCSEPSGKDFYFIFGSGDTGRDVFSACLYGIQKAIILSFYGIFFALIFGLFPSVLLSYIFITKKKYSIFSWLSLIVLFMFYFYVLTIFFEYQYISSNLQLISIFITIITIVFSYTLRYKGKCISFPIDNFLLASLILLQSIPAMVLLLLFCQIFNKPNSLELGLLIGLLYSPIFIKYGRYFTWQRSSEAYLLSEVALGKSNAHILVKSIIPKVLRDMFPIIAFAICNMILLEASIRFLGIGSSIEEVSLGSLLFQSRSYIQAWWMIVFPGIFIYWLTSTFYRMGEYLSHNSVIKNDHLL